MVEFGLGQLCGFGGGRRGVVVQSGGPFHTTIWGVFDSKVAPSLLTFSHGAGKKSCTSACWLSFPVDAYVEISHVSDIYYTKNRHT